MKTDAQSLLLLLGGAGFAAYLVVKALSALSTRDPAVEAAQARLQSARRRARDRSASNAERAAALREAALAALEGLRRPGLAATFARRAERLEPHNPETASLLARALRRAARYSALERVLWRELAEQPWPPPAGHAQTYDELIALYEGPLHRPETARMLKRFRQSATG